MTVQVIAKDSPRLLDRLRAEIRVRHYSIRTEEFYVGWVRRFITYHRKQRAVREAAKLAEIHKPVSPHILRYSFATHLLQFGYDIGFGRALRLTCYAS